MIYRITFWSSVKKDIRHIPHMVMERIKVVMQSLSDNPFPEGSKKLHGYTNVYRIRVGNYRVVYEVTTAIRIITIMRIGHRKDIYKNL